jgi:hypothetical protein
MGVNDQLQLLDKIPGNTIDRRLVGRTVRRYEVPTTKVWGTHNKDPCINWEPGCTTTLNVRRRLIITLSSRRSAQEHVEHIGKCGRSITILAHSFPFVKLSSTTELATHYFSLQLTFEKFMNDKYLAIHTREACRNGCRAWCTMCAPVVRLWLNRSEQTRVELSNVTLNEHNFLGSAVDISEETTRQKWSSWQANPYIFSLRWRQ